MHSNTMFQALAEVSAAAMVIIARETVVYANPAAVELSGYPPDEIVGRSFLDFIHPEDRDLARGRAMDRALGREALSRYEVRFLRRGGEIRYLDISPRRLVIQDEPHILVSGFDVTERRAAQEALRTSEANWRSLVASAPDIVFTASREGRLRFINRVVRGSPSDYIGLDMFEFVDIGSRDMLREAVRTVLETGNVQVRQVAGDGPDGQTAWYESRIGPVWSEGAIDGILVLSTDISKRRAAEERARQVQEQLAHVLRISTMGELATGIAHELNQPLASISNYAFASLQNLHATPPRTERIVDHLEKIQEQAQRAGLIIRRLRGMVRKEDARIVPVDLNEVVQDAIALLRPEARSEDIEVDVDLHPEPLEVLADPIQVQQVVLNLVRNGIEAMGPNWGGQKHLIVQTAQRIGHAELSVRDTGPGVPDDRLAHVFDQFFTTKPNGLGMGLAISRSIIESQSGRLWLSNHDGGGVTARFTLPAVGGQA